MPIDRPTFHESWYRVASLRPRLSWNVQVHRQYFRGQLWYVLENISNNEFSRLSPEAYRFVGMLDGTRTVGQAWRLCNEQLGDGAPTQGEVIQLLGQLYSTNLLKAELSPDTESLFNRYRKRIKRQIQGFFTNLLFIRIPLLDPDHFLNRWVGILGKPFSYYGLALWSILLAIGLYFVISNFGELARQTADILAPGNLALLYLSLVLVKVVHEFSHSFACKRFGQVGGGGGEVHTMGVMFLVFVPLPYMDASSAWAFRKRWHRVTVGAAGMMAELAIASIAAIVWANTSAGTIQAVAHNIIFIASVSTLLFNGNPLLRFDGYYILSDLLEIPNLGQRSRNYLYYLVKRHCWNLRHVQNPAHSRGERIWFVFYGIASTAYRVFICIRILLFLNDRLPAELFMVVPVLACGAVVAWVLVPLGRFVHFLATSTELSRTRGRAVGSTVGALALLLAGVAVLPLPDHCRIEGIAEPADFSFVHTESDGFVLDFLPSGASVSPDGPILITAINPTLEAEEKISFAERRRLEARRRLAQTRETAEVQILDEQIAALDEKIGRVERELASLHLRAPLSGTWVAPDIELTRGDYLQRGERIGFMGSLDDMLVRATAGQKVAAMLIEQAERNVEMRIKKRPDLELAGTIETIFPAGQDLLPSAALGYATGGSMPIQLRDPNGTKAAEQFFEIRVRPEPDSPVHLLTGQRVIVRFSMPSKPLFVQCWRSLRRVFQRRFRV
jgi:putative peptide zinc metalloprotease protein